MTRLAICNAESFLGREIKDALARRRELWDDLRLLSETSEEALVTDIGGDAALVLPATADNLEDVDLLFFCPGASESVEIPSVVPRNVASVVAVEDGLVPGLPPVVAGVNAPPAGSADVAPRVSSAHPALVALAHLLSPLVDLGLEACTASVVLPSSTRGQAGVDQLLAQTRSILAFQSPPADEVFGFQLAFNLVPGSLAGGRLVEPLRAVLGAEQLELAIQTSLGGVFHGLAVGAFVRLGTKATEARIRKTLKASPALGFARHPDKLGPIDVAGSSTIRLGAIEASPDGRGFWLRAVMDNLTLGGALNAIGVAEAILGAQPSGPRNRVM